MSHGSTQAPALNNKNGLTSKKAHPTFHFVAGLCSGISSAVLLQPADLLKTRVQQSGAHTLSQTLRAILDGPRPIASLWRGTVPSALRTGFGSALYFTTLSSLRSLVAKNALGTNTVSGAVTTDARRSTVLPKLSNTENLLTGATARVLAGFILMPMTVIKVRYESNFYNYNSIGSATSSIYRAEGFRGFFTGFGATAIRDAPYAGLYVVFYEASKTWLNSVFTTSSTSPDASNLMSGTGINAASGVVAASTATAITNPFDAVKTRLQLMPQKYGNMFRCTRMMLLEDGVRSFFDGLALRMGRKALSSALAWTVYEELILRAEKRLVKDADGTAAVL